MIAIFTSISISKYLKNNKKRKAKLPTQLINLKTVLKMTK